MTNEEYEKHKEHLEWAKVRAYELIDAGDVEGAWTSFLSDLQKCETTKNHIAHELGMQLYLSGHLRRPELMRDWIAGYH